MDFSIIQSTSVCAKSWVRYLILHSQQLPNVYGCLNVVSTCSLVFPAVFRHCISVFNCLYIGKSSGKDPHALRSTRLSRFDNVILSFSLVMLDPLVSFDEKLIAEFSISHCVLNNRSPRSVQWSVQLESNWFYFFVQ